VGRERAEGGRGWAEGGPRVGRGRAEDGQRVGREGGRVEGLGRGKVEGGQRVGSNHRQILAFV
jgi:hypothetical protein